MAQSSIPPSPYPPIRPPRRRSLLGPLVLIVAGAIFLLRNMGIINRGAIWNWFSYWWPVLFIVIGIVRLAEWQMARRKGRDSPRFPAVGIVFLIFLFFFGIIASATRGVNWNAVGNTMRWDDDWGNFFGQSHDFDESAQSEYTPGALIRIDNTRGDVTVSASTDSMIHVAARNQVRGSDAEAQRIETESKPSITREGGIFVIRGANSNQVSSDLTIQLPPKAGLELNLTHGDIEVSGIQNDVRANTRHGDVELREIGGNATVDMRHGSLTANKIQGALAVTGHVDGVTVSDANSVDVGGEYLGEMQTERIPKGVHFHSPRTELALASVEGRMAIDSEEVNGERISGPIQLRTHAKNIQFGEVAGDVSIEDNDAEIEVQSKTPGNIVITNHKGPIRLLLPPNTNASLSARTSDGDIELSEFPGLQANTSGNHTQAEGNIGRGGARITLNTDSASIEIHKSTGKLSKDDGDKKEDKSEE